MNTMTTQLPTQLMKQAGQSPWLDYISRDILRTGKLKKWIKEQGLLGVTSNPAIFEKAINQPKSGYEADIRKLMKRGASTFEIYDALTVSDIQAACDLFRGVYDESAGEHGFVSLEVIPGLAYYEDATVEEAIRLFKKVKRPNVMIKVPATSEGIPAVRRLIAQGVNVNITLMFSLKHYVDVAEAYVSGLEEFKAAGGDISTVHSVASVFVSRVDGVIDKKLEQLAKENASNEDQYRSCLGKAAIANCKLIYNEFKNIFESDRFRHYKRAVPGFRKYFGEAQV